MSTDDDYKLKGLTQQPVVAERHLDQSARESTAGSVTIRVHLPECVSTSMGATWRCGYAVFGLPGLPSSYDAELALKAGEVWFAEGEDALQALLVALGGIRSLVDEVEKEFGVVLVWPPRADWGHMLPKWVTQIFGREYERRLLDVMAEEEERMLQERAPNPYSWDDPRHLSQLRLYDTPDGDSNDAQE